jgi:hypothetical protein
MEDMKKIMKNITPQIQEKIPQCFLGIHFSDIMDQAKEKGLLYIANQLKPGMRVLSAPHKVKNENDMITFPFLGEDAIKIGSPEFHKIAIADAYIASARYNEMDTLNKLRANIPTEMLRYGHLIYVVDDGHSKYHRGDLLEQMTRITLGSPSPWPEELAKSMEDFARRPMASKVSCMRNILKTELEIPDGLEYRLHVVPIKYNSDL